MGGDDIWQQERDEGRGHDELLGKHAGTEAEQGSENTIQVKLLC